MGNIMTRPKFSVHLTNPSLLIIIHFDGFNTVRDNHCPSLASDAICRRLSSVQRGILESLSEVE